MGKKVHILKDDNSNNLYGLGLVSTDSILQLSLNLNRLLRTKFQLIRPVPHPKVEGTSFQCCFYSDEESTQFFLIRNKNQGHKLINAFSQIDYFFITTGDDSINFQRNFEETIKGIHNISAVVKLEDKKLNVFKKILPKHS